MHLENRCIFDFFLTVTVENHPEKGSNFRAKGIYQLKKKNGHV